MYVDARVTFRKVASNLLRDAEFAGISLWLLGDEPVRVTVAVYGQQ